MTLKKLIFAFCLALLQLAACASPNMQQLQDSLNFRVINATIDNEERFSRYINFFVSAKDSAEFKLLKNTLIENSSLAESNRYFCWKELINFKATNKDSLEAEIKLLFSAASCLESLSEKEDLAKVNFLLGQKFQQQGRLKNAIEYFIITNDLLPKKESALRADCYSKLGICLAQNDENDSALTLLEKANSFYKDKPRFINNYLANLTNQSIIAEWNGDFDLAAKNYKYIIRKYKELEVVKNQIANINNLGGNFLDRNLLDSADHYFKIGEKMALKNNYPSVARDIYKNKYLLHQKKGEYKKALSFLLNFQHLDDSINSKTVVAKMAAMQKEFEIRLATEREKRIEEAEIRLLEEKAERTRNIQYMAILILLLGVFVFLYFTLKWSFLSKYASSISFLGSILLFEFLFVVLDPLVESLASGQPAIKLFINSCIAMLIVPAHALINKAVKGQLKEEKTT